MTNTQSTATRTFVLRTNDRRWIKRNGGVVDADAKTTVQVPADQVEEFTFCGNQWLRHHFTDVPSDALNANIACPVKWVS